MFRFFTAVAACLITVLPVAAGAFTQEPKKTPDKPGPEAIESKLSIALHGDLSEIAALIDKRVPNPVVSINESRGGCLQHTFRVGHLARHTVSVGCELTGAVTKTGPVSIAADGGRLTAALPLHGQVTVRSSHRLFSSLRETGSGDMVVYADVMPRLNPDWSLALNLNPAYRWTDRPHIDVIGIRITVASRIEPKLNALIAQIKAEAEKKVQDLNLKQKAEEGWKKLFEPVKVSDDPDVWLRITPKDVAYAGIRGSQTSLDASAEVVAKVETFVGKKPPAEKPTDLPAPSANVAAPGKFEFITPVRIDFDVMERELEKALVKGKSWTPLPGEPDVKFTAQQVKVYPSDGKIVVGIRVSADFPGAALDVKGWVYLLGVPEVDPVNKIVRVTKLDFSAETDSRMLNLIARLFKSGPLLYLIEKHVSYSYAKDYDAVLAKASKNLTRDLGHGLKLEGNFDSASVGKIYLLAEDMQIELRASGTLKVVVGK